MHISDTIIHINQSLTDSERHQLEKQLTNTTGVIAPRFNKQHLFSVAYNPQQISASQLLHMVKDQGYHAQLVGL